MKQIDHKLFTTMLLCFMTSLNLSSHSGKSKTVTIEDLIYSPISADIADDIDQTKATIGNLVWEDINGDGIQNHQEPGLSRVIVKLYNEKKALQDIKITNQEGKYNFVNLEPGKYYLEFEHPEGYQLTFATSDNEKLDSDVDRDNNVFMTKEIVVIGGEKNLNIDAGFFRCVSISNIVWFDENGNNVRDYDESGINGLSVELYRKNLNNWSKWSESITTNTTDNISDEGLFEFCVPPGDYYLKFDVPEEGFVSVIPNNGDPYLDSDLTGTNGKNTTDVFTVGSGDQKLDLSAGFYSNPNTIDVIAESSDLLSPLDNMIIEVYNPKNVLVKRVSGKEKNKVDMLEYEQKGYYIKLVSMQKFKQAPAHYGVPLVTTHKN